MSDWTFPSEDILTRCSEMQNLLTTLEKRQEDNPLFLIGACHSRVFLDQIEHLMARIDALPGDLQTWASAARESLDMLMWLRLFIKERGYLAGFQFRSFRQERRTIKRIYKRKSRELDRLKEWDSSKRELEEERPDVESPLWDYWASEEMERQYLDQVLAFTDREALVSQENLIENIGGKIDRSFAELYREARSREQSALEQVEHLSELCGVEVSEKFLKDKLSLSYLAEEAGLKKEFSDLRDFLKPYQGLSAYSLYQSSGSGARDRLFLSRLTSSYLDRVFDSMDQLWTQLHREIVLDL